jgi:hypothetical protein
LTDTAQAALAIIRAHKGRGLLAKEILSMLNAQGVHIKLSTFQKHIVPQLKKAGVKNNQARGGYYDPNACPGRM